MNQLQCFAEKCVENYGKLYRNDGFYKRYTLDLCDLPEFVQDEFAGIIIENNQEWASEATGPDNKHWETKMLPALIRYLKNSTSKDEAIEFHNVWRDCVTDYMSRRMQELLDNSI